MTVDEAIDIVATHVIAAGAANISADCWDAYPEIGEHDWVAVIARVTELAPYPNQDRFDAAADLLTARAEQDAP